MKMKIRSESFSLMVLFLINIVMWLVFDSKRIDHTVMILLDAWIIVCYIIMLKCVQSSCGGVNFIAVWLILTLPFYFGQHLFYYYNSDIGYLDNVRSIFNGIFPDSTIMRSTFFSLTCMLVLCFAAIESYNYSQKKNKKIFTSINSIENYESNELFYIRIVGGALFAISLIPTMYYWIYAGFIGQTYGYTEMKSINLNAGRTSSVFIASFISGWFLPSAYMLLISAKSKYTRFMVTLSLAIFAFLIFRAGSRYKAIEIVVAYILIDRYWINREKKVEYKKYAFIIAVVFITSTIVRLNRGSASSSRIDFLLVLSSILGDTGSTSMINCAAIEFIPSTLDYGYGISFLYGIFAVFPAAIRAILFPKLQTDITGNALTKLSGVTWSSFGSSIIAEGYYNFGIFSLLLMAIYGVLLGKIVYIQKNKIGVLSACKFIFYVYFCSEFVFAIRSEFSSSFRSIILYVLLPIAIIQIFKSNKHLRQQ